jgi:hypothetical protein
MVNLAPDCAWWATILVCDWLTRSRPREIADLWYELATIPAMPEETRAALLQAGRGAEL